MRRRRQSPFDREVRQRMVIGLTTSRRWWPATVVKPRTAISLRVSKPLLQACRPRTATTRRLVTCRVAVHEMDRLSVWETR